MGAWPQTHEEARRTMIYLRWVKIPTRTPKMFSRSFVVWSWPTTMNLSRHPAGTTPSLVPVSLSGYQTQVTFGPFETHHGTGHPVRYPIVSPDVVWGTVGCAVRGLDSRGFGQDLRGIHFVRLQKLKGVIRELEVGSEWATFRLGK